MLLLLHGVSRAGSFSYSLGGWSNDPYGAKWSVQFTGTDNNDAAFAEGYFETKDASGNWNNAGQMWNNYRGFANGDPSVSSASGVFQGGGGGGTSVTHCRLVVKDHFGGGVFITGYFDVLGAAVFPVDSNGNPTDPNGKPLPPFAASMISERTGDGGGVIHVTGLVMGFANDGGAHTDILVTLSGTQAVNGTVTLATPTPDKDLSKGTWDLTININDADVDSVAFGIKLTPLEGSSADNAQAKSLSVSWPKYIAPAPATNPATQPNTAIDQSATKPAGTNPYDMSGNPVTGSGYGFGQGGLNNPYAPPAYPVPASTQPNMGTSSNGISTTAPSSQPSNYNPGGPGPGTGAPLTGGGGIIGGKVIDSGPGTQMNSSPSETGVNYGEYGTGGPWDRIRQKILDWLQLPPSMPSVEVYKITIPIPWFDGYQNFDIDFNSTYMSGFRVALRAFIGIFVVIAFIHQVIKDIRAY